MMQVAIYLVLEKLFASRRQKTTAFCVIPKAQEGSFRSPLSSRHDAIHTYSSQTEIRKKIDHTCYWKFATGMKGLPFLQIPWRLPDPMSAHSLHT